MRRCALVMVLALGACSHDFKLVDQLPPDGTVQFMSGDFGTERDFDAGSGVHIFAGFTAATPACPATGFCVHGGLHP